jgi:hypothetical protein
MANFRAKIDSAAKNILIQISDGVPLVAIGGIR